MRLGGIALTERLHGLLYLDRYNSDFHIGCDLETLGAVFDITVGGVPGKLALPCAPEEWPDKVDNLGSITLRPPRSEDGGPNWRDDMHWGRAYSLWGPRDDRKRQATFGINYLHLSFEVPLGQVEQVCKTVAADEKRWLYQFFGYYDLFFKHKLSLSGSPSDLQPKTPTLDLFALEDGKRKQILYGAPETFQICIDRDYPKCVKGQFERICQLASDGREMPLAYQIQLSAYTAFADRDLKKAIVETASATEIALSQNLLKLLELKGGAKFAKGVLGRFRTLGGRVDLAKLMELPSFDRSKCEKLLINPRNKAVHEGEVHDLRGTLKAIDFTDALLSSLPSALF